MKSNDSNPFVSIVLVCRNEQGYIQPCLTSALNQEAPEGGFEIIVADGMSTDGTRDYLDQMAERHSQVRVLENAGRIVSTGLNAAIRAARGDIIVRMDAHTEYAPDYVRQCLEVLRETGADNVGGPMRTVADTYMEKAIQAAFHSPFAVGGARSHCAEFEGYVDTVIYGCWKRSVFDRVGYFDEDLVRNQDDEHNLRLTRAGGKIYQSKRIRSWYHVRGSLQSLFRQHMQYGYWKALVIRKHRMPASVRHLVPGAYVGGLLMATIVGLFWSPAWWAAAAMIALHVVAVTAISLNAAARSQWFLLPVLPVVVWCFHFGYGYGFLRGALDLILLRNAPDTQFVQLTRQHRARPGSVQS